MITLTTFDARTYFDGPDDELDVMFRALRVKVNSSTAYFKTKWALRKIAGIKKISKKEKKRLMAKARAEAQWIKFYERRGDSFASGLLRRVKKHLEEHQIRYDIEYERTKRPKFKPIDRFHFADKIEHRPEQINAANEALASGRGILSMATNAGKTEVASGIVSELYRQHKGKHRVLFFVHRAGLVVQTAERFKKHLGDSIPIARIGGGKHEIPAHGILVATTQTAGNLVGVRNRAFMNFLENCTLVFVDEFHINKAWQSTRIMDKCFAPMRIGLSGTIDEKNPAKMMHYEGMTGPILIRVRNKELVELGRSAKPIMRVIRFEAPFMPTDSYQESYKMNLVYHKLRNKDITREAVRYVGKDLRTMITVGRIAHGKILSKMVQKKMPDMRIVFLRGKTPMPVRQKIKKEFERHKIPVLIVSPIFDVGEDLPGGVDAWINAAGGKGWELVLQRLGRILRRKEGKNQVYVTEYLDLHDKRLRKHSITRLRHYAREQIAKTKIIRRVA